jgi:hypothetical protein
VRPARSVRRSGITLIEVLVAIFITGVGLLALLTLFPLGALELARAIKDDRTAKLAADAVALSEAGEELLAQTGDFIADSLFDQMPDPKTATKLREQYEDLAIHAADIDLQLRELKVVFPQRKAQQRLARLLKQIRLIKLHIDSMVDLLLLLEDDVN